VANNLGKGPVGWRWKGGFRSVPTKPKTDKNAGVAEVVADNVRFLDWPKERSNAAGSGSEVDFGTEVAFNPDDVPF